MVNSEDLREQMEILENVIHFVARELRSLPKSNPKMSEAVQALLDDLYAVLDRHGYHGIVKLIGDVDPKSRGEHSAGWAGDTGGNVYFFRR